MERGHPRQATPLPKPTLAAEPHGRDELLTAEEQSGPVTSV
jgi:hypothetical protein